MQCYNDEKRGFKQCLRQYKRCKEGVFIVEAQTIDEQQLNQVFKKNVFIQNLDNDLSVVELKIIDFLISKIKPEDTSAMEYHTTFANFYKVMGLSKSGTLKKSIIKALRDLKQKEVVIRDEENNKTRYGSWISYFDIHDDNSVTVKLSEALEPYIINLKEQTHYTKYYLRDISLLKSRYSILMYQLLASHNFKAKAILPADYIVEYFNKSDYPFYRVNDLWLKKAIDEINEKTGMRVRYDVVKKGNKASHVVFTFPTESRRQSVQGKVPMIDWTKGE